jgi:serine/threonine-protein kinase
MNDGERTEGARVHPKGTEETTFDAGGDASYSAPPGAAGAQRFEPGAVLADRYRIVSRLGQGGMGEVYRADDLKLEQTVALKFLPPGLEHDQHRLRLLVEEVKVARQIGHPNVCRVFDLGEAEGQHFLSMEYIDGEDLQSLLGRIGRLPWEKAVELGTQLCLGLAAVHDAGILHRDLKPANLMIDGRGRAKLTDFGLAALSETIATDAISSGTPAYMAPEQRAGTEVTEKSDLFALGLLLYELFTGHRALEASSMEELEKLHRNVAPRPPSAWIEGFDPAIERVILECLATAPGSRPDSARQVAETLSAKSEVEDGSQLRTLVSGQLEGGSKAIELLGDAAGAELMAAHDGLTRRLLDQWGGSAVEKGETWLTLFERPWDAVRFALGYHQEVAGLARAHDVQLWTRVGLHFGEVVLRKSTWQETARGEPTLRLEGLAKPTTLRLGSLASARQTLMTRAAFDLARRGAVGREEETGRLRWLAHGEYRFVDAEEPVEVFEVGVADVAPLAAPPDSLDAQRVAADDAILGWRPATGLEIPERPNWVATRKLGEGGFGEVWLGEHRKTGEPRVYKFCYEAERLRSLQREITVFRLLKEELGLREDIARILDWSLDRPPYFVEFAYVDGGSLVDWAEAQGGIAKVPLGDRLEIVAQVATALAAAHSVGVLHKDIKPGNVLITSRAGGGPQAVLTDFGIGVITERARLISKGITVLGMTELAGAGADTGSAAGTQLYLAPELLAGRLPTTRADIYALGVMLYQLAVGDLERPLAQGWERHIDDELLREDIAACVDGTPGRRPASADLVAEGLRGLEERRVARLEEEQAERTAKRALRRRRLLANVAVISSIFLVVVSVLAFQAFRARGEAERRRGQAEQLMDFMLNDLHDGLERIGRLDLLESVARGSQRYFESLSDEDATAGDIERRGMTLLNIGDVLYDQGDTDAAAQSYRAALDLFTAAAESHPSSSRWQSGMSLSELELGQAQRSQGETAVSLDTLTSALGRAEALSAGEPDNREHRFTLARVHYQLALREAQTRDTERSNETARRALVIAEELTQSSETVPWRHWLLRVDALRLIASNHRFNRETSEAVQALEEARRLALERNEVDAGNALWSRRLAGIHREIGMLLDEADPATALESYAAARVAYENLVQTDPTRALWREQLAITLQLLGFRYAELGETARALELFGEAQRILEALVEGDPERVRWIDSLARTHQIIGGVELEIGDLEEAHSSYSNAHELIERLATLSPEDPGSLNLLSWSHVLLGSVLERLGEDDRARREWLEALEIIEPVTQEYRDLQFLDTHVKALLRLGRLEEARPLAEALISGGWNDPELLTLAQDLGLEP